MNREPPTFLPRLADLSDDEAITLRRVAFGESELRTLRPADLARLKELRLIAPGRDGMVLTAAGRDHFDSLPRSVFATKKRRDDHR
jgi:hypothetical protein